ncbi:MAG TPA: C25 family cysteine peptidase, partial [bacterium]|nr:C25 family cysteine peptidase [bacterium]
MPLSIVCGLVLYPGTGFEASAASASSAAAASGASSAAPRDDELVQDMSLPRITSVVCEDPAGDVNDTVMPGVTINIFGTNLVSGGAARGVRLYNGDDHGRYQQARSLGYTDAGTRIGVEFGSWVLTALMERQPFYLAVDGPFGYTSFYRVAYDDGRGEINPVLVPPVVTDVFYASGGGVRHGAVMPLEAVTVTLSDVSPVDGTPKVEMRWNEGTDSFDYEIGTVISSTAGEIRAMFSLVEDGYFISSHEDLALYVYDQQTGRWSAGYPVSLDQRDYVYECCQLPDAPVWNVSGGIDYTDPLDISEPEALIVTRTGSADYYRKLGRLHTVTGLDTEVVFGDDICSHFSAADTAGLAQDIKEYLARRYRDSGGTTRLVLLGGEASKNDDNAGSFVPAFQVYDRNEIDLKSGADDDETGVVTDSFYSDFFYSDLGEWDSNGNGVHNDNLRDAPTDYDATLSVSRLPFPLDTSRSRIELWHYIEKVVSHMTDFDQNRVNDVLFLSNVAAEVAVLGAIDSAWWLDNYTEDNLPGGVSVYKLYQTRDTADAALTLAREKERLEDNYNLVVHMGHGNIKFLTADDSGSSTYDFTDEMAYELENSAPYPIMITGACRAGRLNSGEDCAGSALIRSLTGGAVAYLGNSSYGMSVYGGCQLIDEILAALAARHFLAADNPYLGDLRLSDALRSGINALMDLDDPWWLSAGKFVDGQEYTAKSADILGDGLIPVYTRRRDDAPRLQ